MSGWYKLFVVLHLLAVVFGIGTVVLNGVYANIAKKQGGPAAGAIMKANFEVTLLAEKFIYAVPVFGILAVLTSDDAWEFDQTWIWLSLALYVVAVGLSHAVMFPGAKRMQAIGAAMASGQGGQAEAAEAAMLEKRMGAVGAVLDLMVVVIVVLMVWKPGAPGLGF